MFSKCSRSSYRVFQSSNYIASSSRLRLFCSKSTTAADDWKHKLANINRDKIELSAVTGLYDEWCADYEELMVEQWGYEAPSKCAQLIRQHIESASDPDHHQTLKILDVGSGTGLVGEALLKHNEFLLSVFQLP